MTAYSDHDHRVLIQRLVATLPCSHCGRAYRGQDIFVIMTDAAEWLLTAHCPGCGAESLIRAYEEHAVTPGYEEPPDLAEVAAWHHFLARFEGDLRDLLRH